MQVRIHNVNRPHLNIHNAARPGGQVGLTYAHCPFSIPRNHEGNKSHTTDSLFWEAPLRQAGSYTVGQIRILNGNSVLNKHFSQHK